MPNPAPSTQSCECTLGDLWECRAQLLPVLILELLRTGLLECLTLFILRNESSIWFSLQLSLKKCAHSPAVDLPLCSPSWQWFSSWGWLGVIWVPASLHLGQPGVTQPVLTPSTAPTDGSFIHNSRSRFPICCHSYLWFRGWKKTFLANLLGGVLR